MIKKVSIAYSNFNEEKFVIKNLKKIKKILRKIKNFKYELIVIDDCSSEKQDKLIDFCKKKKIKLIFNKKNSGFYKCFLVGLAEAKYEYYKFFAGDDCTNYKDIAKIFMLTGSSDLIIPYNIQKNVKGKPLSRKFISILYTTIVNILSGISIKYYNGLPVYNKKKIIPYLPDASGYGWQAELIVNCIFNGLTYKEILTNNKEVKFNYSSTNLKYVPSVFFSLIKILVKRFKK
tara:strand:+ start:45 stop:740 length:696 start_codon:yes stop_codon:yes gene_type:complete